jgi:hypothetical protein
VAGAPGTDFGGLFFGWNGTPYFSPSSCVAWLGYWRKAPAGSTIALGTAPGPHTSTLTTGWNLLGDPMDTSATLSLPSGHIAFAYDSVTQTYFSTTVLGSGKGAWVKGLAGETVEFTTTSP